jgi:predicted RNA-binding protein with EMAP domain
MDTANDFRIKLAEKGLNELERLINAVKVQRRKEIAKEIKSMQSEMQIVKFSYLNSDELLELENFKNIVNKVKEIREILKNAERDFNWKLADYWLKYLIDLPKLMMRGEISKSYEAIRFFSGEIMNRKQIGKLWLCSVDCGFRMDVVTNSDEFKPNTFAVIAYLPPRDFGGYISEGMFVPASLQKKGELELEEIRSIADKLGEVESILIELLS